MLYQRPSFTLPANSNVHLSQKEWDRAFLTREEFLRKYPPDEVLHVTKEEFHKAFDTLCEAANKIGNVVDMIKNNDESYTMPDGKRYKITNGV